MEGKKSLALRGEGRAIIPLIPGEREEPEQRLCSVRLKDCGPSPTVPRKRHRDGKGLAAFRGFIEAELGALASFL